MKIKTVGIFCGASRGTQPNFEEETIQMVKLLAKKKITIVYGGAKVGLMEVIADTALKYKTEIIGVMPEALKNKEIAHTGLTRLEIVPTMAERKQRIIGLSDAFITLPGGFGTLDEFFEVVTLYQLGYHRKPFALLNTFGFFDSLLEFCEEAVTFGFVRKEQYESIISEKDPETLLKKLLTFKPKPTPKRVD